MGTTTPAWHDLSTLNRDAVDGRTWDRLAVDFAETKGERTGRTYLTEIRAFRSWVRRFGGNPDEPTSPLIEAYRAYLSTPHDDHPGECFAECRWRPYAPASVKRRLVSLSGFHGYAVEQQRLDRNPAAGVRMPARSKWETSDTPDTLVVTTVHALWSSLRIRRERALVALMLGCALRREEAALAVCEGLGENVFGPTLRFVRKGGEPQTINLPGPVWEALVEYLGDRRSGPLILSEDRKHRGELAPISSRGVGYVVSQIAKRTGVVSLGGSHLYPHLLRKTAITLALARGINPWEVRKFVGHRDFATTDQYDAWARTTVVDKRENPLQPYSFWVSIGLAT